MSIPGAASPLFIGAAAGAAAAFQVDRSLRFNSADSAYLSKTFSSAGDRKTWTWSAWVKRSKLGSQQALFSAGTSSSDDFFISFQPGDTFRLNQQVSGAANLRWETSAVFRDTSSWYHFVAVLDTTQATSTDRVKIYVNGSLISSYGAQITPSQNATSVVVNSTDQHGIGRRLSDTSVDFNGYLANVHFIDGQALAASDFGEYDDNNVWQPKEYSGSYGTNGFYLKFADASSSSALGTDSSGNSNSWTVNNLSATGIEPPTATVVGDPTSSTDNPFGSGNGYSVDFDGNDEIRFTGPGTVTGDLTIECFYKMSSAASGYQRIFSTKEDSYSTEQTIIRRHTNGNVQFYFGNGTPEQQGSSISAGTWYHAAIVYDRSASTVSYYVDGSRVGTDSYSNDVPITLMVAGGGYGSENFQGLISNARITKQALYSGASYTVPTSTLTTTSQGATASNVTLLCCHKSSTTAVEGGNGTSADIDSLIDTPTNYTADSGNNGGNYATINPLSTSSTLANGNLQITTNSGLHFSTIGVSSGKWYAEWTATSTGGSQMVGISKGFSSGGYLGSTSDGFGYYGANGQKYNGSGVNYGATYASGDIIGVALNLDDGNIVFYKNGTSQGTAFTGLSSGTYFFAGGESGMTGHWNFGQRPFAYTPPTGYVSLCTTNLATPTIADGLTAFEARAYTGVSGASSQTGYNFSPDFVWIKRRNTTNNHTLTDIVRGAGYIVQTNNNNAEVDNTAYFTAFTSDGYSFGTDGGDTDASGGSYVAWAWDAGTSTASNTDGSITSSVRANPSAGFSIVGFTGNGSAATIGHGLNAAPELIILKNRQTTQLWYTYHKPLGANKYMYLSSTSGAQSDPGMWNNVEPTSSVFTVGSYALSNNYIAYCFTSVNQYSAFGSYQGNGSNDGTFVFTGFRIAFLLMKDADNSNAWLIWDNGRQDYNAQGPYLQPQATTTEGDADLVDFLSNGFKWRTNNDAMNASGRTYIYAAFSDKAFSLNGGLAR